MNSSFWFLGKEIPLYGVFYFTGIIVSCIAGILLSGKKKIERYDIIYSAVYSVLGGILGAKLLFIVVSYKSVIELGLPFSAIIKGGFVFYGGLIGGAIGLFIYVKQFKLNFLSFGDIYAASLPLGHAIGRVGCYFGGCCYGMEHDGLLSVIYTSSHGNTPLNTPLLAIQLIEAFLLLLLFIAEIIILHKSKTNGTVSAVYLLSYPVIRFILEFFRGDKERGSLLLFSTSQWISILIFAGALILLLTIKLKKITDINVCYFLLLCFPFQV